MTTTIIEYTYYETEDTTTAETTTAETTTAETTTVVTTTAETTTETTTVSTTAPAPEEPIYPEDGEWNRILVNPWNPLPDGFAPELVSVGNGQQADYRVKDALNAMLTDCRKAGYNPVICSSYRTIARQQTLFENETKAFMDYGYGRDEAEYYAAKWVARPGTSEHHTGLAFDIVASSYQKLDRTQADTPEQKWLMANCYKYGFILRYPDDKTDITGINYEPWHYRYVGLDIAKEIYDKQITLEEYLSQGE
ncbi:MAG: M15 family metallopeptidase [Clostridia bacterium]|nr:M15 family metallopeptidase [Clostridia bacterium]